MEEQCPYVLRPHQVRGRTLIRSEILKGHRSPLAVMATGGGKTLLAALGFIKPAVEKGKRVLFMAHSRELINQPSVKLDEIGLHDHGIIMANHWRKRPGAPIQIGTIQTMARRMSRLDLYYDLLFIDEAHRARSQSYRDFVDACREANPRLILIGLTATPYRADGQGLGNTFDCLVEIASTAELMDAGYLVPIRTVVGERLDLSGVAITGKDYDHNQAAAVMDKDSLIGNIVEAWHEHAYGRSTICFAQHIAHSKHIVDKFRAAGVAAEHLDGTTPAAEREAIIARLQSGETTIVSNYGVFIEGFDCPRVSCMIGARATKSRGLWRQMVGRILRTFEDKEDAILLDHANLTDKSVGGHGFITDPDHLSLTHGCKEGLARIEVECPKCAKVIKGHPPNCPSCGAPLRKVVEREVFIPPEVEARMVEITPAEMKARIERMKKAAKERREQQRPSRRSDFWRWCLRHWEKDNEAIAANIAFKKKYEDLPHDKGWPEHADFTGFPVRPQYHKPHRRWEWKARFTCQQCGVFNDLWQDEAPRSVHEGQHYIACPSCGLCFSPRHDFRLEEAI